MPNFKALAFAAIVASTPVYAVAQTQQNDATKPDTATMQKMQAECEARKADTAAAEKDTQANQDKTALNESTSSGSDSPTLDSVKKAIGMTPDTAEEKNQEIVENTKTAPDGSKVVASGPAKPVENWFGCPPEKTEDAKPKQ